MIKAVIFDFAGVVGVDGYWAWLEEKVPDLDRQRAEFHEISVKADRAEIPTSGFVDFVAGKVGLPPEVVTREMISRFVINDDVVRLIANLKTQYKTGLLSNFVYEWLEDILEANDLYRLFDSVIISSRVKMVKPDKEIYELACSKLGIMPSEAVFIDDRQGNIDAAICCGMRGLLFRDVPSLASELRKLGVNAGTIRLF
jgi:epoxide hydrolase-like predicted phosphatase